MDTVFLRGKSNMESNIFQKLYSQLIVGRSREPKVARPFSKEVIETIRSRMLALQHSSYRTAMEYLEQAQTFVSRHSQNSDWGVLSAFDDPPGSLAIRIQRMLADLSGSLEDTISTELRRGGTGTLVVRWNEAQDDPDAAICWKGGEVLPNSLRKLAITAGIRMADLPESASEIVAKHILREMKQGELFPPEFSLVSKNDNSAEWQWTRHEAQIGPVDEEQARAELERLLKQAQPELEDAGLTVR